MKKLLLFPIAIGLLLSANAQTSESHILKSPATHAPFVEQTRDVILTPKQGVNTLPDSKPNKRIHKANYVYYGKVSNAQYAAENLGGHPSYGPVSSSTGGTVSAQFTKLFPDSLASHYEYDLAGSWSNPKYQPFASTGFIFDPYSLDFNKFNVEGLFRDAAGVGLGYRLDTLWTVVDYRMTNYNPSSPDTLRFYISYYTVYGGNRSGYFYSTFPNGGNLLAPYINYADPLPEKGPYGTTPNSSDSSTIIKDYILSDADSVGLGKDKISWNFIELPIKTNIQDGFIVPAGACLGVVAKYIPGYNYQNNDTLSVITWNTEIPSDNQYIDGKIYNNYLSIANWNYDMSTVKYMFDQTGYNSSLHETQKLRYKDTIEWGYSTYHAGYYGKPVFYMGLSVSENDTVYIIPPVEPGKHRVSVSANDPDMGYVTGSGNYPANSTITISATA
ncbi:MAG: hypothetical protein LBE13_07780, partial [Bacteroidales bacterium]|nr:hypothetical protein [Bacteroidales bacterium]